MVDHTINLRRTREATDDRMAQYESPDVGDVQAVCTMYANAIIAEALGEFGALTISDDSENEATLSNISGNGEGNYGVYETPKGAVTGLYVSHEALSEVTGEEPTPENAPETIGIGFSEATEDDFRADEEAAEEEAENEAEALVVGGETESVDSDEEESDEEVEVSDEELGLVDEDE